MSAIHDRRGKSRCWASRCGSGVQEGKVGSKREETKSQGRVGAEAGEDSDVASRTHAR